MAVNESDLLDRIERLSCELGKATERNASEDDRRQLIAFERDEARGERDAERATLKKLRGDMQKLEDAHGIIDRAAGILEDIDRRGGYPTEVLERIRADGFLQSLRKLEQEIDPVPF